jgi:hypothetical protein
MERVCSFLVVVRALLTGIRWPLEEGKSPRKSQKLSNRWTGMMLEVGNGLVCVCVCFSRSVCRLSVDLGVKASGVRVRWLRALDGYTSICRRSAGCVTWM